MKARYIRYAITNRENLGADEQERGAALLSQVRRLAARGVDYLQLREKDLPPQRLAALGRRLLVALEGSPTRLLLNGRADVAVAIGVPGVHLTGSPEELTPEQVRRIYAEAGLPEPVVTVSCHTLEEVARCSTERVSAILFGPVFEKVVAGERVVKGSGLERLGQACRAAGTTPVLALGGVTGETVALCLEAGASGIAAIRLFQDASQGSM